MDYQDGEKISIVLEKLERSKENSSFDKNGLKSAIFV
jgi:hypothetical protein